MSTKRKTRSNPSGDDGEKKKPRASAAPKKVDKSKAGSTTKAAAATKCADKHPRQEGERRYWLIKSEPEPRFEKGIDVSFSLDALTKEPDQTTFWDGVRNYSARNILRDEMKLGDLAFFYHSNTKIPGCVGIVEIVKEGYPDETAFDTKDPHYDPKSDKSAPRWFGVDVKFMSRLDRLVSLPEMKSKKELQQMALFTKARLSVQPVTQEEWNFILDLSKQPPPTK